MSNLTGYSLFYRYAKRYTIYIFGSEDHIEEGSITNESMARWPLSFFWKYCTVMPLSWSLQGGYDCQLFAVSISKGEKSESISSDTFSCMLRSVRNHRRVDEMTGNDMDQLNKDSIVNHFRHLFKKRKLYVINRLFLKSVSRKTQSLCLFSQVWCLSLTAISRLTNHLFPTLVLGSQKRFSSGCGWCKGLANNSKALYWV